jgi:hypothetical protein
LELVWENLPYLGFLEQTLNCMGREIAGSSLAAESRFPLSVFIESFG